MPRALKVLDPACWSASRRICGCMKDTNGDLKADTKELVDEYLRQGERRHRAQREQLVLGDGQHHYSSEHNWDCRFKNGKFESQNRRSVAGSGTSRRTTPGASIATVNDSPLYVDYDALASYFLRNPNVVRTRGL